MFGSNLGVAPNVQLDMKGRQLFVLCKFKEKLSEMRTKSAIVLDYLKGFKSRIMTCEQEDWFWFWKCERKISPEYILNNW